MTEMDRLITLQMQAAPDLVTMTKPTAAMVYVKEEKLQLLALQIVEVATSPDKPYFSFFLLPYSKKEQQHRQQ